MEEISNNNLNNLEGTFFQEVITIVKNSQQQLLRSVNQTLVLTYFEIGRRIVEEEQNGANRAGYGKQLLIQLSERLTTEFGKGFSVDNLERFRKFYIAYSNSASLLRKSENLKSETLSRIFGIEVKAQSLSAEFKLSWSHYILLSSIDNDLERNFYEIESVKHNWSVRELKRQYNSALFTRLSLSRNKEEVLKLAQEGQIIEKPKDLIKDPYILEFLGLPEKAHYSEEDLETEIIDKLESFLMELGHGFTFVARQKRITFDDKHFYIDLVFYNRILKCFVLIDLKIGELKHQDLGQMQMYVNYYDREMRLEDENQTIGIILCQNKSDLLVEYSLPKENEQIFASKYKTVLPTVEEFKKIIL
ncbi:PDDEXK nuclease domain-containing protein [Flavobacterium oreochromis]|uniref:PDDEXK nuclease domain-containing protein n=1 Tax=Flavobacterium oreochromis TaxID=2906078 RepID=UPI003858C3D2